jgi:hypothetical protein
MQPLDIPKLPSVRDFAYAVDHPLHYGVDNAHDPSFENAEGDHDDVPWASQDEEIHNEEGDTTERYNDNNVKGKAIALFDFVPENDNEFALKEGQIIWINYRHGQGWLVAADFIESGDETANSIDNERSGLVPEEYVQLLDQ